MHNYSRWVIKYANDVFKKKCYFVTENEFLTYVRNIYESFFKFKKWNFYCVIDTMFFFMF